MQTISKDSEEFVNIDHKQSLYIFFADNRLQKMDKAMNEIDANCKDADGFLYGAYTA